MLLGGELTEKVKLAAKVSIESIKKQRERCDGKPCEPVPLIEAQPLPVKVPRVKKQIDLVAIGTSTGGPAALTEVFKSLPKNLAAGIVIAQHMPPGFTSSLASRLNDLGNMPVKEAENGDILVKGRAYLAPAGFQTEVEKIRGEIRLRVFKEPPFPTLYKPSVDVLFNSVAQVFGPRALGVVMTGMGSDGAAGSKAIKKASGYVLAQDETSSIVYGMPKAAVEAGAVDKILPLAKLPVEISNIVGQ